MTVDMTKVTAAFIADNAAGTLQGWFEGYTDPDDEVGGQVKVKWVIDIAPHPTKANTFVGCVQVAPMERYGVDESRAKRFLVALKVIDAK